MADVLIEHCTLRVIRHGGWRWGAEPQQIVAAATRVLPEILARHLGELWPEDAEGEITAPVQIAVQLPLAELAAVSAGFGGEDARRALEEAVAAALARVARRLEPVRRQLRR